MPDYRRAWHAGGTCFFTVNLSQRNEDDLLVRHIDFLRDAIQTTKKRCQDLWVTINMNTETPSAEAFVSECERCVNANVGFDALSRHAAVLGVAPVSANFRRSRLHSTW
jgi:hypothetical protein